MTWPPDGTGGLGGAGSFAARTRTSATNTSFALSDGVIEANCTGGLRIFTLPTAASAFNNGVGSIFTLKKIDASANVARLQANGAELIDGFNNTDLAAQYESIAVQSNGTSWDVLFRSA